MEQSGSIVSLSLDNEASSQSEAEIAAVEESLSPKDLFTLLYQDLSLNYVKEISRQERISHGYTDSSLSYGEIEFEQLGKLFDCLEVHGFECKRHSRFVDIGSGSGKPVFIASLLYKFESCQGIEILKSLVELSLNRILRWTKICTQKKLRRMLQQDISFDCGDALKMNWSNATVVFIHATAFNEDMIHILRNKLTQLQPNAYVIMISRSVESQYLEFLEAVDVELSWGSSIAYLYRRSDEIYVPEGASTTDTEFLLSFGITYSKENPIG